MSVGSTRVTGTAGAGIDLSCFKAGDLAESKAHLIYGAFGWQYGTGANQVQIIYADTVTLADGANTTISLYDSGSYYDIFGAALTLTSLKFLYIKNNSSDATLKVGGGASADLDIFADTSDVLLIPPGGVFVWINPSAAGTVCSTNKNLKIEHDGTGSSSMNVDIIAMGLD